MNSIFFPTRQVKDERINLLINKITKIKELLSDYVSINNFTIGFAILIIHILIPIIILAYILFGKITNRYKFILLLIILLFIIAPFINLYYGGYPYYGCFISRLERYFFNNKEWFSPFVWILLKLKLCNIDIAIKISNMCVISYILLTIFIIIKRGYPLLHLCSK